MKPSKKSNRLYMVGVIFFAFSVILFVISTLYLETDYFLVSIGFFTLCIFWILGIQYDLYKEA